MAKSRKDTIRFNAWTLGVRGADLFDKSPEALELERLNPLRGVDEWRLGQIFDDARDGVYADLAWLYNEIEGVEPALAACCDMRESAASECGWLVRTSDADRVRGFDQALADEQRAALLAEFGTVEDDLTELAGHLASAFFRGAAHALPLWNADGTLAGFRHLDLWNFALDRGTGVWYWNADASRDEKTFQAVPPGALVSLAATRHVDHAALPIFIRAALGAKRYGVWLDRFGIPPVGVIMPQNAERGEQASYMDLARKFARGGSGVLPNGSSVVYGTEARAVCPFLDFIRFQQQQIYTLGIGRVQSGDTDGANLGGNAAGVVEDGFRRLVRRDARRIARAVNDGVTAKVLSRLFPGRPVLAQFAWDTDAKRTGREVLEDAGFAKDAGLAIDLGQLRELTGYDLSKAPETPLPGPFGGLNSKASPATPLQTALQGFAKREEGSGRTTTPETDGAPQRAVLAAFATDTSAAAERVKALLDDPTPEAAEKLLADLPSLIPEDPALAAVIADAMAAEFTPVPSVTTDGEATNAEGVCTSPNGPDACKSPTCPGAKTRIRNVKSSPKADEQSRAIGYQSVKDMMSQAKNVPAETVARIQDGFSGSCKAHEAVAVISENKPFNDAEGNVVKFGDDILEHYIEGRRRANNEPKVSNLTELPFAIKAVKSDTYGVTRLKYPNGGVPDPLAPPRGTQREYHLDTGHGTMKVFVYIDGGKINGWHVQSKMKKPR